MFVINIFHYITIPNWCILWWKTREACLFECVLASGERRLKSHSFQKVFPFTVSWEDIKHLLYFYSEVSVGFQIFSSEKQGRGRGTAPQSMTTFHNFFFKSLKLWWIAIIVTTMTMMMENQPAVNSLSVPTLSDSNKRQLWMMWLPLLASVELQVPKWSVVNSIYSKLST